MYTISKKGWTILSLFFLLILIVAFALPLQSNISETVQFSTNPDALFRQLRSDTIWREWWPGKVQSENGKIEFHQNGFSYTIENILPYTFALNTIADSFTTKSYLHLISKEGESITLTLTASIPIDHSPISRIKTLLILSKLKVSFKKILSNLSSHYSGFKNLYNLGIHESTVPFEYVTTLSQTFGHNPSVQEIYALIDRVKVFIKGKGGSEKGSPMLFTTKIKEGQFFVQVAIPTNKSLPDTGKIKSKWMLKGGNILSAQVTGNRRAISKAKKQIEYYIQDHRKSVVAIPYEYLITDRLTQPDSNKWVTQIYFPVI